jgi:pimeloyl-ACP methyl ester carboxylesterase
MLTGPSAGKPRSAVIPLREVNGAAPPLVLIHGVDGEVDRFTQLLDHLPPGQLVYAIRSQTLLGEKTVLKHSVEDMAAYYLRQLQRVRANGPYCLLGFSFGGLIAFEMARRLPEGQIALLVLVDTKAMGKTSASQARPRDLAAGIPPSPYQLCTPQDPCLSLQELAKAIEELLGSNGSGSIPACGTDFDVRRIVRSSASKLTGQ